MAVKFIFSNSSNKYLLLNKLTKLNMTSTLSSTFTSAAEIPTKLTNLFEEVQIPVPWGHISAKWYGPKNVRPIVGLHGWQDNAGTFDTLAPLLPANVGFLSLDLPGHGLSSRIPDGMFYNALDNVLVLRMIMKEYKWDKISILGHSMSSIGGFCFSSFYPDKVEMLIGLDALKPHQRPVKRTLDSAASRMEKFILADERNRELTEPPSYTYDELIEKLYNGTFLSINKDKCPHLLARNIRRSTKYPDKYYFTRDSRIKYYNYNHFTQEICIEMAKKIQLPYLFIKAKESSYFEEEKYFHEVIDVLQKFCPKFEFQKVDGTHHVHLNDPESIAKIINPFILKHHTGELSSNALNNKL